MSVEVLLRRQLATALQRTQEAEAEAQRLTVENLSMRAEINRLSHALRFYGKRTNYWRPWGKKDRNPMPPVMADKGYKAREALGTPYPSDRGGRPWTGKGNNTAFGLGRVKDETDNGD